MSISDRLDEIAARADAATEGPWETNGRTVDRIEGDWDGMVPHEFVTAITQSMSIPGNAEFIAASRTDVPALVAALRAVLDLCDKAMAVKVSGSTEGDAAMAAFASATRSAIAAALGEGS